MKTLEIKCVVNGKKFRTSANVPDSFPINQKDKLNYFLYAAHLLGDKTPRISVDSDGDTIIMQAFSGKYSLFEKIKISTRSQIVKLSKKYDYFNETMFKNFKDIFDFLENAPADDAPNGQKDEQPDNSPSVKKSADDADPLAGLKAEAEELKRSVDRNKNEIEKYLFDHFDTIKGLDKLIIINSIVFTCAEQIKKYDLPFTSVLKSEYEAAADMARDAARLTDVLEMIAELEKESRRQEPDSQKVPSSLRQEAADGLNIMRKSKENGFGFGVYYYGPAGSGKSTLVCDIAKNLNVPLYCQSAVFNEFELFGFANANGVFVETPFYKAFKDGGVFLLDELDCSDVCAIKKLNGAIANGFYEFPVVGRVDMNKDCYIFATGNTNFEPSADYTAAQKLDASSVDRFFPICVEYSEELEKSIGAKYGNIEAVEFVQALRKSCVDTGVNLVCSLRMIQKIIAATAAGLTAKNVVKCVVETYIDKHTAENLAANMSIDSNNAYYRAMCA